MFYISWGTKVHQRPAGMAANFCPICRRATGVLLWEIHKQNHVYHIGVGASQYVGRFCRCMDCGSEWTVPDGTIRMTLDPSVPVTLDYMVAQTYPNFHTTFADRLQLEEVIARGEAASLPMEARLKLIAEPFFVLDNSLRKKENAVSGGSCLSSLGCLGSIALAFVALGMFFMGGIWSILAGIALLALTVGLGWVTVRLIDAQDAKYMREEIYPTLAPCLAPLYPSAEELEAVKKHSKSQCASRTEVKDLMPLMGEVRASALERLRQAPRPQVPSDDYTMRSAGADVMPGAQASSAGQGSVRSDGANPWTL